MHVQSKIALLYVGLLLTSKDLCAQFKVTFLFTKLTGCNAELISNWQPKNEKFGFKNLINKNGTSIDLLAPMFEYKFTMDIGQNVETGQEKCLKENRQTNLESSSTVNVELEESADHLPKESGHSTAKKNVHIIDTAFFIPQLKRYRRIWIYLPPSYPVSRKKYPVLYMQDGQNVFDEATSFSGEWGVDETLDTLGNKHGEMIVVAVDNGGDKRMNEYAPYDMEKYGKGEGDLYVDFLVNTLQPYLNKHYRTQKKGKYNYVAGSSMGGLISLYAILKYPNKFGGAGVFSPAFWINPTIKNIDPKKARKVKGRIYFFAGQQESETMVPDMLNVFEQMRKYSKAKMQTVIRAKGKHNEATWRVEFPLFYQWLSDKN